MNHLYYLACFPKNLSGGWVLVSVLNPGVNDDEVMVSVDAAVGGEQEGKVRGG